MIDRIINQVIRQVVRKGVNTAMREGGRVISDQVAKRQQPRDVPPAQADRTEDDRQV
ncbi:MAG: hypothetical protein ACPGID_12900 [Rubricella sp.]